MSQASLLPTSVQSAHLPLISIVNGQPITTSLNIAEVFGKRHKNVLRAIEDKLLNLPEDFSRLNFELTSVIVQQPNGGARDEKLYNLTFDGFSFIVMGFTGAKADAFKIAYIEEFNRMRNELANTTPTDPTALTPSTTLSRKPLTTIIKVWAKQTGQKFSHCYSQVNAYFNLEGVAELPVEWLPDAIAFVQTRLDEHQKALESTQQKALPPAAINLDKEARDFFEKLRDLEEKQTKERDVFNAKAIQPFFHLVYTHEWVYDEISEVLRKTARDAIADGYTREHDTQRAFKLIEKTLRLVH